MRRNGVLSTMSTCSYCGAETRPGDNFCLSCGKPIVVPNAPSSLEAEEATMLGSPLPVATPDASQQQDSGYEGATMMASPNSRTVENPGQFVLISYREKEIQNGTSYGLDKVVTTIGRAPENDIVLLDEDKVISRYHATLRYENGTYQLIDNGSSNGTSVNGQQIDKQQPHPLQDGDHVTVGEYELVYYAPISVSNEATMIGISPVPNFETVAFGDQPEEPDEGGTATWNWDQNRVQDMQRANIQPASSVYVPEYVLESATPGSYDASQQPAIPVQSEASSTEAPPPSAISTTATTGVTMQRFSHLAHPLPDIASLIIAASALNGQVAALQEQLHAADEATQEHQTEVSETALQLREGMRQVSDQVNTMVIDGNQSRDIVHWEQLQTLLQDVIRNPRDIDNARSFAYKAADVNIVLQKYDALLQALEQCNNQLRRLIGEDGV